MLNILLYGVKRWYKQLQTDYNESQIMQDLPERTTPERTNSWNEMYKPLKQAKRKISEGKKEAEIAVAEIQKERKARKSRSNSN